MSKKNEHFYFCLHLVQAVREQGGDGAKQIYVDLGPNIPKWSEYKGILITSNPKPIFAPET